MRADNLCYSTCPARQYGNVDTTQCTNCPYDCYTCDSVGDCLTCNDTHDFRVISSAKRCILMPGYFDNLATVSVRCSSGCSVCPKSSVCTICFPDYYLRTDKLCYTACLDRTFPNRKTWTCDPCPYDCLTCDASFNCLNCSQNQDHRVLNSTTNRCIPIDGFFDTLVPVSEPCHSSCFKCFSLANCSQCNIGFFLRNDSMCYTTCLERQFASSLTLACEPCPPSAYDCWTCDRSGKCLTCSHSDHRILDNTTQKCIPVQGYYENMTTVAVACPI